MLDDIVIKGLLLMATVIGKLWLSYIEGKEYVLSRLKYAVNEASKPEEKYGG